MFKVIRQNAGFTQKQVARLLGQRKATLSDWENEKKMPNGTNLIKLCVLYNKTPKELYPDYYATIEEEYQFP